MNRLLCSAAALLLVAAPAASYAQAPDRVLVRTLDRGPSGVLAWDQGSLGLWHRLQKLRTTASVLYTAGHPDDEQPGVLTELSRGGGARTALLTLNRGEGGANAIGPELFDGLGLIRTEELRLAGRHYGLDDQYYTTAVDYGYSKTMDEAFRSWDREHVLGDMVRIIRLNRPLVVISRWHGSQRDGHGHHQASGALTPEAVEAAADPSRFPEQIRNEGLRPWRVRKLFRGRVMEGEPWHVEVDPGSAHSPLGRSYEEIGRFGLSLQRSQTSGRMRGGAGPAPARFERLFPEGAGVEASFFDGLATSLSGVFALTGENAPTAAVLDLVRVEQAVNRAIELYSIEDATRVANDLELARTGIVDLLSALPAASEAAFLLRVKLAQVDHALIAAAGIDTQAFATRAGERAGSSLGVVVPGQELDVHISITNRGAAARTVSGIRVLTRADAASPQTADSVIIEAGATHTEIQHFRVPDDAEPTRPWFSRGSIENNMYVVNDSSELHLGESRPDVHVALTLDLGIVRRPDLDAPLVQRVPVRINESQLPYGTIEQPLVVAPRLLVRVEPAIKIVATGNDTPLPIVVEVTSNDPDALEGSASLEVPEGWRIEPESRTIRLERVGTSARATFTVHPGPSISGTTTLQAIVQAGGRSYSEGYEVIRHRDLDTQRLYRPAAATVVPVDVSVAPGLRVGYVMGVGDQVPAAITELGVDVTLLDESALTEDELRDFDAIVVGTRAYAVRPELAPANARLLDYMRGGGHLVVLYQTPEYRPDLLAPHPATLPGNAQEVSEEDAAVRILAPDHPLLFTPNRIDSNDFDNWVEQRGSKFFATWADAYTPLVETHDTGQEPQQGVWMSAEVGEGHFTYIALALHRQLPYGVPGAYRILANLLSLGADAP